MKTLISAAALCAALALAAPASAQPTGGPDAKGNAPLKRAHTVNDGAAKPGRSSFTEGQARTHIEKSGYTNVEGLSKGKDGVWRGSAMKNGSTVQVAMDFKGNVVEGASAPGDAQAAMVAPPRDSGMTSTTTSTTTTSAAGMSTASGGGATMHHRRRHHRGCSLHPGPNGAACSGVDRNKNGVSDKEDRATGK